ncbi:MAG TPA: single-stranded DNA-binding protein [Jiangellaceae bacterium]|nr:single-stranded DNA-binding protein [Jiangellaceae bacterium]
MADITITGNTAAEPELRFTPNGKAVATFSVAENHRRKVGNEWQDDGTTWWRITVWERQAETLAETLGKGDRVLVTGTVRSREWEKDGEKRTSYDVTARHVAVIPKAQQGQQQAPAGGQQGDPWAAGQSFGNEPPF